MYAFAARQPDGVSLDALMAFAKHSAPSFDRHRVRSQFHNWKTRGWFENPGQGLFRATAAGKALIETEGAADVPAPAAPSEIESADEPTVSNDIGLDLLNQNPPE